MTNFEMGSNSQLTANTIDKLHKGLFHSKANADSVGNEEDSGLHAD
jgi:hypothetical protein